MILKVGPGEPIFYACSVNFLENVGQWGVKNASNHKIRPRKPTEKNKDHHGF